ncbi:MAG: hypothetical protein FWD39_02725 [Clostridiales bacterium]|nr:hypothetical protein [Clostridiales bacterium]
MGGQLYEMCLIVTAAKKALRNKSAFSYVPYYYVRRSEFQFLPETKYFGAGPFKADNAAAWYDHCLKKGLQDIKLFVPISVKNRYKLAFANSTHCSLVCFWKEHITCFSSHWENDYEQMKWDILYREEKWRESPQWKPHFGNNSESFRLVLVKIKELAEKLDGYNSGFEVNFQNAIDILDGSDFTPQWLHLPEIPEENLRLYRAANAADVFGGMLSWNDGVSGFAEEKGLREDYETLSNELLKQIRLATLYAINGW